MKIAKPLAKLIESFQKLPGIGPKTAQRLGFYLLHVPQEELDYFAKSLSNLKKNTVLCTICRNVSEEDPCPVCSDIRRDKSMVMVVEQPLDVIAFERTGKYQGLYHVLHGAISPLENVGPDEIFISDLLERVAENSLSRKHSGAGDGKQIVEVIVATNPTMEGDATAMYIAKKLKVNNGKLKITRLGMGIPTGADLEYADETTLREALEGRRDI